MGLARRVERLEWGASIAGEQPRPVVIICGPGDVRDDDRGLIDEIVQARTERAWPHGLVHCVVTGPDVEAWRDGRREEAIRGIGHRRGRS